MPHVRPLAIVESALRASDAGVADADNARQHDVTVRTIRRWRRHYQEQGLPRGQMHCSVPCPRCEDGTLSSPHYAELFGWYLGDGSITRGRRDVHNLHVVNDAKYVQDIQRISDLMREVKPGGRPHTRSRPGCTITTVSWKHWPCLLPQHGPGPKHRRPILLEDWQRTILEGHPAPFLRGLFHSDGSRVANRVHRLVAGEQKHYVYPRWQFTNHSGDIRELCCWALDLVGVPWRQSNRVTISVSTRPAVAMLDGLIGLKQ